MWGNTWGQWGLGNHYGKALTSDMGKNLVSDIDKEVQDMLSKYNKLGAGATVTDGAPTLTKEAVDKAVATMKAIQEKEKINIVNEILEEKGYPEFDIILKHFLDNHPEYKL